MLTDCLSNPPKEGWLDRPDEADYNRGSRRVKRKRLSALYAVGSNKKRLLDAMLFAVPR